LPSFLFVLPEIFFSEVPLEMCWKKSS